jgi:peptide/nickel transport system substrate-binding protein
MRPIFAACILAVAFASPLCAQTPERGGTLIFSVTGEPETFDCHASVGAAVLHRVAPHYSTLLRIDPAAYPKIAGDLAERWQATADGLVYRFALRSGVKFHDGTDLTSADVKASYERIKDPPAGTISARRSQLADVVEIAAPDPRTVEFRLSRPNAAMPVYFASPWNCIYSAKMLAENPAYPARAVMGSGPFRFVEQIAGSEWRGRRFENYHRAGLPYLDEFRAISVGGPALVNALAGGQTMADFRGLAPAERDRVMATRGDKMNVAEADQPGMLMLTFNAEKGATSDARVRRALSIAIDRWAGAEPMARLTFFSTVGGFQRPGSAFARDAADLEKLPGFARDMAAARAEARRLLAEAGQSNLQLTLTNRPLYTALGLFLVDQWRQIGVTVRNEPVENQPFFAARASGNFEIVVDAIQDYVDEPSLQFLPFLSLARNPANIARTRDAEIDAIYDRQSAALDPDVRRQAVRDLEALLLTRAYTVPLYWARRIIVMGKEVRGYTVTPSSFVGQDLADIWLAR